MASTLIDSELDLDDLRASVGPAAYRRGAAFASRGNVSALRWDADNEVLRGTVLGDTGRYHTEAELFPDRGRLILGDSDCSCPVGVHCKHVAALIIAASRHTRSERADSQASGSHPADAEDPDALRDAWTQPLLEMLAPSALPSTGTPLAIELALEMPTGSTRGTPRLLARLMRPGARGGWVNGSLSWGSLEEWDLRELRLRADQVDVARALGRVDRARQLMSSRYWYGQTDSAKILDLSDWEEAQLWPLLERVTRAGITLIHAVGGVGDVPGMRHGELVLDVRTDAVEGAVVSAGLELEDGGGGRSAADPGSVPVMFIGAEGHGLVLAEAPTGEPVRPANGAYRDRQLLGARLRLVRLARSTPLPLRQQVLGEGLRVPAADLERFRTQFAPALRNVAPTRSSDGSFSIPEVSAPELVLRVRHADGQVSTAEWGWRYEVGEDSSIEVDLSPGGSPLRDRDAEARALAAFSAKAGDGRAPLTAVGLSDDDGRPVAGAVVLRGLQAADFIATTLPLLSDLPGVDIDVEGVAPDYRAVDDSLEIGVGTSAGADSDWFDLNVTIRVDGRELPFSPVFAALARGESRLLLDDGAHFSLLVPELDALRRLIEEAQALGDGGRPGALRISRYQAGLWHELVGIGVVREQAAGWQQAVDGLLGLEELTAAEMPAGLTADLRHYQQEGFSWLVNLYELGLGGILADDMGLGKTVQVLALICHVRRRAEGTPFLVVAPTSVVPNWAAEAARFTPGLRVRAIGDTLARAGLDITELVDGTDVVVTTYNLLRLDAAAYGTQPWAGVILDEAQAVKNHTSKAHAVVRRLQAPFKLAVSGTPLENNLMELWSLLSIVAPGLFPDPAAFKEHYQFPIERVHDGDRLALLRRRVRPLMMRRRKELVAAELPQKQEQTLEVSLHPKHRKLYDTYLQRERRRILGLLDDFDANRFSILTGITRLRQLSLHAGLLDPEQLSVPSAKLEALSESLAEVAAGGHRALVFSQFTGFLGLVRQRLDADGIEYCYLDGKTRRRAQVLDAFKQGSAPAFLISLKAGGFGLNLTEADYCFLLDPWWNPAAEAQAVDRTHRIGQTRQVMVYRMVSQGTVEEKVVALARRKAELFASVIDDSDLFSASVTAEDVRSLLN